jgi:hypothetical protein
MKVSMSDSVSTRISGDKKRPSPESISGTHGDSDQKKSRVQHRVFTGDEKVILEDRYTLENDQLNEKKSREDVDVLTSCENRKTKSLSLTTTENVTSSKFGEKGIQRLMVMEHHNFLSCPQSSLCFFTPPHNPFKIYYESIKRELKRRPISECRCDERLKTKVEEFTRLTCTGLLGGLEHLKIETRLIDEKIENVMGEYVT